MVEFTDNTGVYYYRNPNQTVRRSNQFYVTNFGQPVVGRQVYNPTTFNNFSQPTGATGIANSLINATALASQFVPGAAGNVLRNVVDTAAAVRNIASFAGNVFDPSSQRLSNSNLPPGADYFLSQDDSGYYDGEQSLENQTDTRVILTDPTQKFLSGALCAPLKAIGGVLFPYNPTISVSSKANYDNQALTHSNYEQPFFVNSTVSDINVSGTFTASNQEEAKYVMAVIHFFRSVTKMFYGADSLAGTPPPVLFLDGYGSPMFDHVPVVVTDFSMTLPDNVDYISTTTGPAYSTGSRDSNNKTFNGSETLIPSELKITVNLRPTYSRQRISQKFGLESFASGGLLTRGKPGSKGPGGFI